MATVTNQYVDRWLKDAPASDLAHLVVRTDRELLVSYCGRAFPATQAAKPVHAVRLCMDCKTEAQRQYQERRTLALMRHFKGLNYVPRRQHS